MQADIEHEIAEAESALRLAMLTSDVASLDRLISADLVFTTHLGQRLGKSEDLEMHRSRTLQLQSIDQSEMLTRISGAIAVVSVRSQLAGTFGGTAFTADLRYTRLWQRNTAGAWQVLAGHASAVQAA